MLLSILRENRTKSFHLFFIYFFKPRIEKKHEVVLFKLPNFDRVFTLQEQKIPYPGAIFGLSNLRVQPGMYNPLKIWSNCQMIPTIPVPIVACNSAAPVLRNQQLNQEKQFR
jgi:hypothetical protein